MYTLLILINFLANCFYFQVFVFRSYFSDINGPYEYPVGKEKRVSSETRVRKNSGASLKIETKTYPVQNQATRHMVANPVPVINRNFGIHVSSLDK